MFIFVFWYSVYIVDREMLIWRRISSASKSETLLPAGGAAHAVGDTGQEEDALREGALAVAAVAEQSDVADVFCCVAHVWVHSFLYLKRNVFPKINHLII